MRASFSELLGRKQDESKFVCVGLDSDANLLPSHISGDTTSRISRFNYAIMDATADVVEAWKPNLAFYLAEGRNGIEALEKTIRYGLELHPDIPIILDAKDADIGNTNVGYVQFAFEQLQADAVTVNPYLGQEALAPFLARKEKGIIVLCRTSNKGGGEFQDLPVRVDEKLALEMSHYSVGSRESGFHFPLFEYVAYRVSHFWNENSNCALVAGATYPEQLGRIRSIAPNVQLLIPGIGKQGGDIEQTVRNGRTSQRKGMIINSSSGVIFASRDEDFATAARSEAVKLHEAITTHNV